MRYLPLFLLLLALVGCQSQPQQPDAALIVAPQPLPSATVTVAPSPVLPTATRAAPTATMESSSPTPIVTHTSEPVPAATQDSQVGNPGEPTPVVVTDAYPEPIPDLADEPIWGYRIVNEYPHDTSAYTQGLVIEDDLSTLLEGTGRDSSLRRVDLQTGEIQQNMPLPEGLFGEGITLFGDQVIQLTWRAQMGFVYDNKSFELLGNFSYPHQGWGITHNGSQLIVSDGTETIRFWDPDTFQEVRRIQVEGENGPVTMLNELEYVNGEIWANIWHSDYVARISPEDGRILGWIDLAGLLGLHLPDGPEAVLNGIAYDEGSGRLFATGKLWPSLFEIEIVRDNPQTKPGQYSNP